MGPGLGMLDFVIARVAIDALETERSEYLTEVQRYSTQFGAGKETPAKDLIDRSLHFLRGHMI